MKRLMLALLATVGLVVLAQPSEPPDVLIVILDDVGRHDREDVPMPVLDSLAAQGAEFSRAYGQPWCQPFRDSLYFGYWQGIDHGRTCDQAPIPRTLIPGTPSLPRYMQEAGYATSLIGKWHLGTTPDDDWEIAPLEHGFERWMAGVPDNVDRCIFGGRYTRWLRAENESSYEEVFEYQTDAVISSFRMWWESNEHKRRFSVVALQAPHAPFHIPPEHLLEGYGDVPVQATAREKYEAMLYSADFALGEILQSVDLDTTLVVVIADNGTPQTVPDQGQDPTKLKHSVFEGGVGVPMVLVGPGVPAGTLVQQLAAPVDIWPTISKAVGMPILTPYDGQSLWPALSGDPLPRQHVAVQKLRSVEKRAIIEPNWKLIDIDGAQTLYDLLGDPAEEVPIDPDDPFYVDVTERLRGYMLEDLGWE